MKRSVKVTKINPASIPETSLVKCTDMGNIKEIMYMQKTNMGGVPITRLDKNNFMINDTGEIKQYSHNENRAQSTDSLRRTFKHIRHLINYNFQGADNELAFTITYKENMTDPKRLYDDFHAFIKRLRYKYQGVEYFNVVEPQGRGAWHMHVLLKFTQNEKIYIPNKEIAEMWGYGFVKVKAIRKDVDNIGAYLSAYLGDVELDFKSWQQHAALTGHSAFNSREIKNVEVAGKKKTFIKGGRLHLYPPGMNIYRKSKGIKEPPVNWVEYSKIKKEVGNASPDYKVSLSIDIFSEESDSHSDYSNTITYEHYNMKRRKK